MEKISVTVKVPALHNSYDFLVPENMPVKNVQKLMIKILESEYGISGSRFDVRLFDTADGSMLGLEYSFTQLEVSDGAKLVLM